MILPSRDETFIDSFKISLSLCLSIALLAIPLIIYKKDVNRDCNEIAHNFISQSYFHKDNSAESLETLLSAICRDQRKKNGNH